MNFCGDCGNRLEKYDRFCGNCGSKISNSEQSNKTVDKSEINLDEKKDDFKAGKTARVSTRVKPIYGSTFDNSIHCKNCGGKRGNAKICPICKEET